MNLKLGNFLIFIASTVLLAACSSARVMMPTPNEALDDDVSAYRSLHPELKSTQVPLFYVTDRVPQADKNGDLVYGHGRSSSMAFGTTVVDLGQDLTWEDLLDLSRTNKRGKKVKLKRGKITEIKRGPPSPIPYTEIDGKIVEDPEYFAMRRESADAFRKVLVEYLERTPRKEVHIFIHGFHNSFDDAAFTMAELWHFMGRYGVPIVYTWPANHPGIFGYTYDRESSEFTVYHLRQLIEFIATWPEVEKINILAHSRGTDVAVTVLRELTIEVRAKGLDPKKELKIHNFVLAAPDLDAQVAGQRIIGDHLAWSAHRFTVYTSPADRAIGWSDRLFDSPKGRIGNLQVEDVTDQMKAALDAGNANLAIVNFYSASDKSDSDADSFGHSYFRNAPTVSSDLILTLRDDLDPGTPGRPLQHAGSKFWRVPPGYPNFD